MINWIKLTTMIGKTISSPDEVEMKDALQQLFLYGTSEHPDCWLEKGSETGQLDVISVFASGYAIHTQYTDADMCNETLNIRIDNIDATTALQLWRDLIHG